MRRTFRQGDGLSVRRGPGQRAIILTPCMPHGMVKPTGKSATGAKAGGTKEVSRRTGTKAGTTRRRGRFQRTASDERPDMRRSTKAVPAGGRARSRRRTTAGKAPRATGKAKSKKRTVSPAKPRQRHTTGHGKRATELLRAEILQYYDASGFLSWSATAKKFVILGTNEPKGGLVPCPECGLGQLMVVRSKSTRKRFIGCSNYYSGCDASSPLLQRARLRALKQPCPSCAWPMVIFRYSRNQKWTRQCSNVRCSTRAAAPPA